MNFNQIQSFGHCTLFKHIKSNSDSKVPNVKKPQNNSSAEIYILFYYITHYTFNNQIPVNIQQGIQNLYTGAHQNVRYTDLCKINKDSDIPLNTGNPQRIHVCIYSGEEN